MNLKPIVLLILIAIFFGLRPAVTYFTEYLWFDATGYASVFLSILSWKILIFLTSVLLAFAFLYFNIKIARSSVNRILGNKEKYTDIEGLVMPATVIISLIFGSYLSNRWETIILYFNMVPAGIEDPIFLRDISFYMFQLPLLELIRTVALSLTVLALIITGVFYLYKLESILEPKYTIDSDEYMPAGTDISGIVDRTPDRVLVHISVLLGLITLIIAYSIYLSRFEILFSQQGIVTGAGYTDIHVRLPLLTITSLVCTLVATGLIANVKLKNRKIPVLGISAIVLMILLTSFAPTAYQQIKVEPTELQLEEPYLLYNIEYTRAGFGLSDIDIRPFDYDPELTHATIENNRDIIDNIRIWDERALQSTYKQTQQIRTYYDFNDIDTDRYNIDGQYRQFMIGVREMDISNLDPSARTWVNERLVFTHGFGAVMNNVNEKTDDGRPVFSLQDIPPMGDFDLANPRIYYGELTTDYKIVNTDIEELDYPSADGNVYASYKGSGGVQLDSIFKRLAYMVRFGDVNFILSQYLTDESRVIYDHQVNQRASTIAPFLVYESNPIPVIHDGKVFWIIDAYTVSDKYPYSEKYGTSAGNMNYIRNSVKVVIDAYEGTVDYYIMEDEPLINTYAMIFPDLFKTYDEMPENLKQHIRYPKEFFSVQMQIYRNYHMTNVETFYNKEDAWQIPNEFYRGTTVTMEPYYIMTRLSEEENIEYILMQPFTPRNRQNMIAWVAARSDGENYGQLVHYEFPKDRLVYGPNQIEARIDQDPLISELFTLWGQQGSSVIRGNLLVVPLDSSILYIEPVFISADQGEIPELRRIIVSSGEIVYMGLDLETSLQVLLGEELIDDEGSPVYVSEDARELASRALEHYNRAQEHLQNGDWAGYGQEMDSVYDLLEQISQTMTEIEQ
ncbi:UPF0182 family membrane protein [Methanolobus psychrotolerans]|uniref:UPF0182 family membrane protein n=1 Tax=Methanolobus psychrotolerans TaxID=1874706 RepID=UPI000B919A38|nr:UPF0182 family protein [Methanolobus psychrotolerans]